MSDISEELFNQPQKEFTRHLSIPYNERIIFSGMFGMGKTTFLNWYFTRQDALDKYNVIQLFPVNYSVASNEDIFRYVKYDIITELLNKNFEVKEEDVSVNTTVKTFVKKNYENIVAAIIHMIPLVGKQVIDSYEKLRPLISAYDKIKEDLQIEANEGDKLISFLEGLENTNGNIFEDDIVTKTIEGILQRAKVNNNSDSNAVEKENILIIDDLDRIDPEHIFRLLNVFAAHFDGRNSQSKNKFGFDKVVFVCDIKNIREIFRAKYGLRVDFNGYIDKFFSNTIFTFDHSEYYSQFAFTHLSQAKFYDTRRAEPYYPPMNENRFFLKPFLTICTDHRLFDLRNLIKWRSQVIYHDAYFKTGDYSQLNVQEHRAILALRFLHDIKGDIHSLYDTLELLRNKQLKLNLRLLTSLCGELVLILKQEELNKGKEITHVVNNRNLKFIFKEDFRDLFLDEVKLASDPDKYQELTENDFVFLLHDTARFMENNKMFK